MTKRKEVLMKYVFVPVLVVALLGGVSFADEPVQLKDENDRVNYSYGFQIGDNLRQKGVTVDTEILMKGIQDALSGAQPLMTQQEIHETLVEFNRQKAAARRAQKQQQKEQYRGEGREFLAANAKNPGIVTLPSGLQYKVIREGTGKTPGPHDSVTVNYRSTLINGQEFDSSYSDNKPATFRVDGVIKGWTEALQLMREGAKWQLFIPADLGYGERGPLADRLLIFDVELISVQAGT
jgi:FKBP-type peptidyl-prolyl cis-trans isomerase FklB